MIMQCIDSEVKMVALEPRPSKIIVDVMDSIQAKFDFRGHNVRLKGVYILLVDLRIQ